MSPTAAAALLLLPFLLISTITAAAPLLPIPPSLSPNHPPLSDITTIFSTLNFQTLSSIAATSLPNTTTPITIFAPTDSSLLTCPSCSLPQLLQEHSVPGLYPFHLLQSLPFGTKFQTLSPNHCLTLTRTNTAPPILFINGVQVTRPNLYTSSNFIIHALQGYISHLSPLSCHVELMTTLSYPPSPPAVSNTPFFIMRLSLKDVVYRLRISGFTLLSLSIGQNFENLLDLQYMTIFAINDAGIFGRHGHAYVSDLMLHFVPHRRLMAADLIDLPVNTSLPTLQPEENVVVTVAGGGGPLAPMRINHVKITRPDMVYNERIAVHGVSGPFPRVRLTKMGYWPDRTADV